MHKCENCNKDFESKEGYQQHMLDKHNVAKAKHAINIKKSHIFFFVVILAVGGLIFLGFSRANAPGKYDDFATCLEDNGAKLYGTWWCTNCAYQKRLFGRSEKLLPYVECSDRDRTVTSPECIDANIQGYPTWIFENDSRQIGIMSIKDLSEKTGCELN